MELDKRELIKAKEFLKGYINAQKKYESARLALEEVETMINHITVNYDSPRVSTSPAPDKLAEVIDRLITLRREAMATADEATKQMEKVYAAIQAVRTPQYRQLLTMRYISGYTMERIGKDLGYSYSGIDKVHKRALKECIEVYIDNEI